MQITALPERSAGPVQAGSPGPGVNYDAFLRLLIATMRNQDPTAPNDPSETLSQLASFSVVEQGIATNKRLDSLIASTAASSASALIGMRVESADGTAGGLVTAVEVGKQSLIAVTAGGIRVPVIEGTRILPP